MRIGEIAKRVLILVAVTVVVATWAGYFELTVVVGVALAAILLWQAGVHAFTRRERRGLPEGEGVWRGWLRTERYRPPWPDIDEMPLIGHGLVPVYVRAEHRTLTIEPRGWGRQLAELPTCQIDWRDVVRAVQTGRSHKLPDGAFSPLSRTTIALVVRASWAERVLAPPPDVIELSLDRRDRFQAADLSGSADDGVAEPGETGDVVELTFLTEDHAHLVETITDRLVR